MKDIHPIDSALGNALRAARTEARLTQRQLAAALGWHDTTITQWEKGVNQIKATELIRACRVLGVSPGELMDAVEKSCP